MTISNEEIAKYYAFAKILGCNLSLEDFKKKFADLSNESYKELSSERVLASVKPIHLS